MNLNQDPTEVAEQILKRSICAVQVGSVMVDDWGIFSWGWNSVGNGFGVHAERHCLTRANRERVKNATIYVAARRMRNRKIVSAQPCPACMIALQYCKKIVYRDKDGEWKHL